MQVTGESLVAINPHVNVLENIQHKRVAIKVVNTLYLSSLFLKVHWNVYFY